MATIIERTTKDGKRRYTVQIRLRGAKPINKTFDTKTAAKAFVQTTEADIRRGAQLPGQESTRRTLSEVIERYKSTVMPSKAPSTADTQRRQLDYWRERIGHMTLASITPSVVAEERDQIAQGGEDENARPRTNATVTRYLAVLSHCFSFANRELGWTETNPVAKVTKPKEPRGRVRILSDEEREALLAECEKSQNSHLYDIVVMALATAARRGELRRLEWRHVDLERRVIVLDETKNGDRRVIPVRGEAERILKRRSKIRRIDNPFVFPAPYRRGKEPKPVDFQSAWDLAVERAGLEDFRFHDLRHCAASYLAMNGATLAELAEVLGHRTLQMVKRYSHFTEGHTGALMERMNEAIFSAPSDQCEES